MKSIIGFIIVFSTFFSFAQCTLKVTIKGIDVNKKGTIRVGLFSEKGFPNAKQVIDGKVVKVSGNEITVEFKDLKIGDYAIAVVHDQNQDQKLTKNLVGYPIEPYAFSNNAIGNFGPPNFKDASFKVDKKLTSISISLK